MEKTIYDLAQEYRIVVDMYDTEGEHKHRIETDYPKEGTCDEGTELKLDFQASWLPPGTKISIEIPTCPKCGETSDMQNPWHEGKEKPSKWPKCHCGFDWASWCEDKYS